MRTPIVFVHGIGVGLVMYMSFIKALLVHDCPIVCGAAVDLLQLAARKVPSISEQVKSIDGFASGGKRRPSLSAIRMERSSSPGWRSTSPRAWRG